MVSGSVWQMSGLLMEGATQVSESCLERTLGTRQVGKGQVRTGPKKCLTQIHFTKFIFEPKTFWTQILLDPKFYLDQRFCGPKFFRTPKIYKILTLFDPKIF